MNAIDIDHNLRRVKVCMAIIITGLTLSGITAFPIETELDWLTQHNTGWPLSMRNWLSTIYHAIKTVNQSYPYLSYGTDWLAFAHVMLAILFTGPYRDPLRNKWVIEFGIIACISIFPLAFIAGSIRYIPVFWRFIDCSFGVIGIIPLLIAKRIIDRLEQRLPKAL